MTLLNILSALAENEVYLDSIEGKLKQLSAAGQEFSNSLLNSDLVKLGVDAGTNILSILTQIMDALGGIPAIAATAAAALSFKNVGWPKMTGDMNMPNYYKNAA